MKDYDAYLFDWDGTLGNTHALWLEIVHGQLRRHNIHLSDREVVTKIFGRYLQGLRELGFSEEEIKHMDVESVEAGRQGMSSIPLFPGALDVLQTLRSKGKKLALITASYREAIDGALRNYHLTGLFDVIITGDQMQRHKPDPESLIKALQILDVRPDKALMLGDSSKDLLAANNAGTDSLLFFPPEHEEQHSREELEACGPAYTVRSWHSLLEQLQ